MFSVAGFGGDFRIMSGTLLGGLWTYPSISFPDHDDFMFIDEVRGRIVMFVVVRDDPPERAPVRNWYQQDSATSISVRLRLTEPWRVYDSQIEGNTLSWNYGGAVHPWRRVPWKARPDWLDARLNSQYTKMDAAEKCS